MAIDLLPDIPNYSGLLEPGNVDVEGRLAESDKVQSLSGNEGASGLQGDPRKDYRGTSYQFEDEDGSSVLLPNIADGSSLNPQQAIEHFKNTGEHMGRFTNVGQAASYGQIMHQKMVMGSSPRVGPMEPIEPASVAQVSPDLYRKRGAGNIPGIISPQQGSKVKPVGSGKSGGAMGGVPGSLRSGIVGSRPGKKPDQREESGRRPMGPPPIGQGIGLQSDPNRTNVFAPGGPKPELDAQGQPMLSGPGGPGHFNFWQGKLGRDILTNYADNGTLGLPHELIRKNLVASMVGSDNPSGLSVYEKLIEEQHGGKLGFRAKHPKGGHGYSGLHAGEAQRAMGSPYQDERGHGGNVARGRMTTPPVANTVYQALLAEQQGGDVSGGGLLSPGQGQPIPESVPVESEGSYGGGNVEASSGAEPLDENPLIGDAEFE